MFCKKSLSAILSLVMVVTMVVSVIAMPAAAATENGNVPFSSPAITANVGETIDLTKYGVEFAEGVSTKDGLTWWKNTASTVVPFKQPAILANVGDTVDLTQWGVEFADGVVTDAANISWQKKLDPKTVTFGMPAILTDVGTQLNFAEYPVELTEGNVVAGDKLTWKVVSDKEIPLITFVSPAIPANVGDVIDLTAYAVEFENDKATMPSAITWANGETAVTSFTPDAKGVTALTATANGVSKTIYVVAKEATDTKYVLYRNDFGSADAVAEMHKSTMGSSRATATYAEGGYLSHLRNDTATATHQSMLFAPSWLSAFGAYRLEASVSVSAYGNTGRYFSFLTHGSNTAKNGPYYVAGHTKAGKWFFQKNTSATAWGLTAFTGGDKTGAFTMNVDTYYTYALEYDDGNVTSYMDGTQIMQFTVPDATPIVTGRPGIGFHGVDATADYFEVALVEDSIKTATYVESHTEFTPAAKGVTAFTVSDGETTKKVYVVAKNAEDTEYVLYENDFNEAADLDELTRASNCTNASSTVEIVDGKLNIGTGAMWHETYMLLPEFIGDFGDYYVETSANITAQMNNARYIGLLLRVNNDSYPFHVAMMQQSGKVSMNYRNEDNAWATDLGNAQNYTAAVASGVSSTSTYFTMAAQVSGDTYEMYVNGTKKLTLAGQNQQRTGRVGIVVNSATANADYIKVTVSEPAKTEAVTAFTPQAAGVTELVATVNGVSKSVYVVAKEESDNEYVLYQNDFDTAASLADVTRLSSTAEEKYPIGYSDGNLTVTRASGVTSAQTTMAFPAWLANFGDYTIESSVAIAAQTNNTRYYALVFRGNDDLTKATPYYASIYNRSGTWRGQRRLNTTNSDWNQQWDNWAGPSVDGAFTPVALGTYATHKVEVQGDTATAYYNGTEVGTYTPTDVRDTGFVGLFFHSVDAKVDYFKVTLSAEETEPEQLTTFTPDKAGVTALTVKDAEDNEKTVYVVAKQAADTEYVLYENDFNNAFDANALTVAEGAATLSVENGKLTVATSGAYVYLPAFLGDFGDYKMQMVASTTTYGASSDWLALLARGQHTDSAKEAYVARIRHSSGAWDAAGYYYRDADDTMHRHEWGGHATISQGSTHTYTLLAQNDLITFKQDENYVFYANEPKEHRVGQIGFAMSNVTLSVDSIRVTLSDVEKPVAPVSASFTADAGLPYGTIAGNLTVKLSETGDAPVDVVYYWGDGNGKLANYGAFDKVLVKGSTAVNDMIPKGTVVPAGATELRVYTANEAGESDNCVVVPLPLTVRNMTFGEEKLSFQAVSDTHIMPEGGSLNSVYNAAHLADLLQDIARFDPDSAGLFQGGDIVDNGKVSEYEHLNKIWDTYGNGLPLEGVLGNHEYWNTKTQEGTVTNYATYTGAPITPEKPYYSKNVNGYDFFFLNTSIIDPSGGNHNVSTLGDTQIAWLDAGLAAVDADTPAFIFHHQKFNQIADADALKAVLAKYPNAIFLTSHTHNDMNTAGIFEYENATMCKTANTSAVSYTVYTHYNPNGENVQARSQAYYVEIYEDRVLFRGMDIMTDEWLPSAQFVFWYGDVDTYPTDANLYPVAKNEADAVFEADFSELSALVASEAYSAAGAYVPTDTDTAVNEWVNARFGLFMNQEGSSSNHRELTHLGQSTLDYATDNYSGDFQWNILSKGALLMNVSKNGNGNYYMGGQMMRKNLVLTVKGEDGDYLKFKDFEAEMVFNKAGANTLGAVFVSFRETTPGQYSVREGNASQNTAGTLALGVDGVIVGNAPTTYAYGAVSTDGITAGNTDGTNNNNQIREPFTAALDDTADYKLTVKVIGTTLTAKVTKVSDGSVVYDNTASPVTIDNDVAGYLSFGVSNAVHEIKSVKVTKLNGLGLPVDIAQEDGYVGGNIETVDMVETDNGYQYTIEITPDAGYELQAGSLYAMDANGNYYVPTRVGFRNGGDASRYTLTIKGEGAVTATFMQPTKENPNIGNIGTSINQSLAGLRFVSRFTRVVENDTEYVVFGNEKLAIADYGMLLGLDAVVGENELNLALAESNQYVQKLSVKESGIYYDNCTAHVDMSVCITGVDKVSGGADMQVVSRTYVVLENGDVLYGNAWSSSYNETLGIS